MENNIFFQNLNWYPDMTTEELKLRLLQMRRRESRELLLVPAPERPDGSNDYVAFLLSKYYTEELGKLPCISHVTEADGFHCLHIAYFRLRHFFSICLRWSNGVPPAIRSEVDEEAENMMSKARVPQADPIKTFLDSNTPAKLEAQLSEKLIGQPALSKAVADFLYYHALRQLHPELPQRPLMISGPSGSGKTEIWRVAKELYGDVFPIRIIDGSNMSCEGWAGNYKIDTFMEPAYANGGILVVDEFDKLTKPRFSSANQNVALDMQAEFLKLIEGEYQLTKDKKATGLTSKKMGFVLVGAFESLTRKKLAGTTTKAVAPIGFAAAKVAPPKQEEEKIPQLTDDDFIRYGMMPELVGRIAAKCTTNALTDQIYVDIIRAPSSRVSTLIKVLSDYGAKLEDVISDEEILKLVATSQANQTGVRWVVSQVESRILASIYQDGLHTTKEMPTFDELFATDEDWPISA